MTGARVRLGRKGEDLAVAELQRAGYHILDRNWRCPVGEVDVVALQDAVYRFFEVRTRRGGACGTPEESITPAKYQRMIDVALTYLAEHDLYDVDCSVGLVAVEMDRKGHLLRIEIYESIE